MTRTKMLLAGGGIVLLVVIGASAFFVGDSHAVNEMSVRRASPYQLAEAMRNDQFFSSYRENTLLVRGTVTSTSSGVLGLRTGSSYSVSCDLGSQVTQARIGDAVTILAEGATAERQPAGVLLHGCTIP
jgi:hypothetical protein